MKKSKIIITFSMVLLCGVLLLLKGISGSGKSQHDSYPIPESLKAYGYIETYCYEKPLHKNPTTIPQAGCFQLSPGRFAAGYFSGHHVVLSLDQDGKESYTVDNQLLTEVPQRPYSKNSGTNMPFVQRFGDGFSICDNEDQHPCPMGIETFKRNSDKSVIFSVLPCIPNKACYLDEAVWKREKESR